MLLNESDLKTLIKSIIKEVRDESFSDDLLDIPSHMSSESGLSSKHSEAVRASVKEIRKIPGLHQVDAETPIYDHSDIPSKDAHEVVNTIISICRSLDESLPSMAVLRSRFYNNELPQSGGVHTIADIVNMFIPR